MEDAGLQIITLWGPTIGHFENINFEILDLPSPKGSKTRVHGGRGVAYIYTYICVITYIYDYLYIYIYVLYYIPASSGPIEHIAIAAL